MVGDIVIAKSIPAGIVRSRITMIRGFSGFTNILKILKSGKSCF